MKPKANIFAIGSLLLLLSAAITSCAQNTSSQSPQIANESSERLARIRTMAENWPKEPVYSDSLNPLDPSAIPDGEEDKAAKPATITAVVLPSAANGAHELVTGYCSGCHSLDIVIQQHASPRRWKELLVWMEQMQGMPALPKEDETKIIEYLSANFGADG